MRFDFIGRKSYWFILSGVVILAGMISVVIQGLSYSLEFKGGVFFDLTFNKEVRIEEVRRSLEELNLGSSVIQMVSKKEVLIRTRPLSKDEQRKVVDNLKNDLGELEIRDLRNVSASWGKEITRASVAALLLSLAGILIYVSLKFEFKMAISAISALIHDLLVLVGVYSIAGKEVSPATVAAILTILGYSLYDTIVLFHRIQENTKAIGRRTYGMMVNDSINQVLVRSINTSLTSILPVVSILIFGGETLKDFAFALFVGLVSGTYSSIFTASPILVILKETEPLYRNLKKKYGKIS